MPLFCGIEILFREKVEFGKDEKFGNRLQNI